MKSQNKILVLVVGFSVEDISFSLFAKESNKVDH